MDLFRRRRYHLHFFGRPQITEWGDKVSLSDYQFALLALLGGSEEALPRQTVIDLLWSNGDEATRRRRLNQLLYVISRRVGEELVERDLDALFLNPDLVSTDLEQFKIELSDGLWSEPVRMLQAGFLTGVSSPTRGYSSWVERGQDSVRELLEERLEVLWRQFTDQAQWDGATALAVAGLDLYPENEAWLRRAIRSKALEEGVERAVAVYERWNSKADHTITPQTEALLKGLRDSAVRGSRFLGPARDSQTSDWGDPPFIGRREEIARFERSLASPISTFLTLAVIGEAGVGKTRLLTEAMRRAEARGFGSLMGQASEFESMIALGPIAEILSDPMVQAHCDGLEEPWRAVLRALLPGWQTPMGEPPPVSPTAVPRRLFESLLRLFQAMGRERSGLVLAIDDVQWADETTIGTLEFLRKHWSGPPGLLLVAARTEDLQATSTAGRFIHGLTSAGEGEIVELGPLNDTDGACLAECFLGQECGTAEERKRLLHLAQGNPLFLVELARLRKRVGDQALSVAPPTLPRSLTGVLLKRVDGLSLQATRLLEVLAVQGRPTVPELLGEVEDEPERCVFAALDELEGERLVRWNAGGIVVRHPLLARLTRDRLSKARSAWLHRRLGETILAREGEKAADQVAVHFHEGGQGDKALHYAQKAATLAVEVGAYPEAARFLALAILHEDDERQRLRLKWREAEVNFLAAHYEKAGAQFKALAEELTLKGLESRAGAARLKCLELESRRRSSLAPDFFREVAAIRERARLEHRWPVVLEALESELRALDAAGQVDKIARLLPILRRCLRETDEGLRHRALPTAAIYEGLFGDHTQAVPLVREAIRRAEDEGAESGNPAVYNTALAVFCWQGLLNTEEGRELLVKAEKKAQGSGDLYFRYGILLNRGNWHLTSGDLHLARAVLERTWELIESLDLDLMSTGPKLWYNWGLVALAERNFEEAALYLERFRASLDPTVSSYQAMARAGQGICALSQGRLRDALAAASEVEPFLNHPALVSQDPLPIAELHARIAVIQNDFPKALAILECASELCKERRVLVWIWLKLLQARVAKRAGLDWEDLIGTPLEVADDLGLTTRVREFRALQGR